MEATMDQLTWTTELTAQRWRNRSIYSLECARNDPLCRSVRRLAGGGVVICLEPVVAAYTVATATGLVAVDRRPS